MQRHADDYIGTQLGVRQRWRYRPNKIYAIIEVFGCHEDCLQLDYVGKLFTIRVEASRCHQQHTTSFRGTNHNVGICAGILWELTVKIKM